jgi:hypothetical protein
MKKLRSKPSGAALRSITETKANNAAEESVRKSPKDVVVTAVVPTFRGDCSETRTQPTKLKIAALNEHHLNGSRQISREKIKVKTEDVDERTVLVATDVYMRLELKNHCAQSHIIPIVEESRITLETEDFCLASFVAAAIPPKELLLLPLTRRPQCLANRGKSSEADDALLKSVTKTGFSKCTPENIIWIVTLDATHRIIVPPSIKKPSARLREPGRSPASISMLPLNVHRVSVSGNGGRQRWPIPASFPTSCKQDGQQGSA